MNGLISMMDKAGKNIRTNNINKHQEIISKQHHMY